jgi:hypothetical protein
MSNLRISAPLVFANQNETGGCSVRLITCMASNEVRVYSRESVSDASREVRLNRCQIFHLGANAAPKYAQSRITQWQEEGFAPLNSAGRAFDLTTQTLSEGVSGVLADMMATSLPFARLPWWAT